MSLNDLNQQLYDPNSKDISKRAHEQSVYDPTIAAGNQLNPFENEQRWEQAQKGFTPSQKKKIWIGISLLSFVLLIVGGFFLYGWWLKGAFFQDRVLIRFEGPKEADSTQNSKYVIHYENNNRVTLKNAEIRLSYPENFQPTDNVNLKYLSPSASKVFIGDIKPMSKGSIELKGFFFAPKDFPVYLDAQIVFVPSNGNKELYMQNRIGVNITAAPVALNVAAPQQIVDGDSLEYIIDYKNLDIRSIEDVQLRVELPQGFQMSNAEPKLTGKETYWYLGNLESNQGGKVRIQGQIKGISDEGKNILVSIGHTGENNKFIVYNKQEVVTRIVAPVLAVTQKLEGKDNDVVSAGELLKYSVMYQNTGDIGLRDAIITAEIKGKILDFSKINVEKGFYDSEKNTITWKASDVPALANINQKASGVVRFSVPVKTIIPIENELDKNFVVTSVAKIDSPDIPTPIDSNKVIGSNKLELKLASKVLFETRAYYTDQKIKNSGPIPMESGKETTFAVHWVLVNVSNDISEAKVVSSLPSGVRWTGQIYPTNEKVAYNARTNQIIWDAGIIPAGAGISIPPREMEFQVGLIPQASNVGEPMNLINKSIFTAKDIFVNRELTLENESRSTTLYEDPSVGFANSKVAK